MQHPITQRIHIDGPVALECKGYMLYHLPKRPQKQAWLPRTYFERMATQYETEERTQITGMITEEIHNSWAMPDG